MLSHGARDIPLGFCHCLRSFLFRSPIFFSESGNERRVCFVFLYDPFDQMVQKFLSGHPCSGSEVIELIA